MIGILEDRLFNEGHGSGVVEIAPNLLGFIFIYADDETYLLSVFFFRLLIELGLLCQLGLNLRRLDLECSAWQIGYLGLNGCSDSHACQTTTQ